MCIQPVREVSLSTVYCLLTTIHRPQAQLCVTVVTRHHHFFKAEFAIFQAILSFTIFFLLPEAFCGLKHAENAIAAGAPPRTGHRWGSSRRSPKPPSQLGRGHPSTYPTTLGAWRVDARAFGDSIVVPPDTKSYRLHWSPPLFKVKLRLCNNTLYH